MLKIVKILKNVEYLKIVKMLKIVKNSKSRLAGIRTQDLTVISRAR